MTQFNKSHTVIQIAPRAPSQNGAQTQAHDVKKCKKPNSDVEAEQSNTLHHIDLTESKQELQAIQAKFRTVVDHLHATLSTALNQLPQSHQFNSPTTDTLMAPILPPQVEETLHEAHEALSTLLNENIRLHVIVDKHVMTKRIAETQAITAVFFTLNRHVVRILEKRRDSLITTLRNHTSAVVAAANAPLAVSDAAREAFARRRAALLAAIGEMDVREGGLSSKYRSWFDRCAQGGGSRDGGEEWGMVRKLNKELLSLTGRVDVLERKCAEMDCLVQRQAETFLFGSADDEVGDIGDVEMGGVGDVVGEGQGKGGSGEGDSGESGWWTSGWKKIVCGGTICAVIGVGAVGYIVFL